MSIFSICALSLCTVFIILFLRQIKSEYALPLVILLCILLIKNAISMLSVNMGFFNELFKDGIFGSYSVMLMKTLGISLVVQSTSDICRDANESAVAEKIELVGKAEIMVISIPLIKEILEITKEVLS